MFEWVNLLPKPVDPLRVQEMNSLNMLRQAQMRLAEQKMTLAERQQQREWAEKVQARNALAQLMSGQTPGATAQPNALAGGGMGVPASPDMAPSGLAAGGIDISPLPAPAASAPSPAGNALAPGAMAGPSPQAMAAAIAAGADPRTVMAFGTLPQKQIELQQAQQRLQMDAQKAKLAQANMLYERLGAELLPEYEANVKKYGDDRALSIYYDRGGKLLTEMRASGDFGAIAADIKQLGPPATLRANATSVKDYYAQLQAQETAQRALNEPTEITVGGRKIPVTKQQYAQIVSGQGVPELSIPAGTVLGEPADVGKVPEGSRLVTDPKGGYRIEPIPGSPAARSEKEKAGAKQQAADIVVQDIDRALKRSNFWTTGFAGARLRGTPQTGAYDLAALLDTIKANVGFERLQQMRDQSPTGGALGQITEREHALLQATAGNLDQAQSREQFETNLKRLRTQFNDVVHGTEAQRKAAAKPEAKAAAPQSRYQEGQTATNPQTGERVVYRGGKWVPM